MGEIAADQGSRGERIGGDRCSVRPLKRGLSLLASVSVLAAAALPGAARAQAPAEPTGKIGRTYSESIPFPPARPPARAGAPNVLVWMVDDVGFGQIGAYGGLIDTPNIDAMARGGLSYTNFHSTPICSASRAAFLTGRNPHAIHVGSHAGAAVDFPGYDARIPPAAGTVAENLQAAGYVTYALGKWDHLPSADVTAAGPFTYWPREQGFDRFYGFLSAEASNFHPTLWSDQTPVEPPPNPNYHLSADLADHAIQWIGSRDANSVQRPFFMYWATGAAHAPHHAPKAYLDRYRGRFDMGWDAAREMILKRQIQLGIVPPGTKLGPRPSDVPAWDSLTPQQKRLYARQMEAFAAALTHADAEFGRILDTLRKRGELDNTMIVFLPDNGASAEGAANGTYNESLMVNRRYPTVEENSKYYDAWGSEKTHPHYAVGWAIAGNTPFQYYKQTTFEGGIRVPLIISWPKGIAGRGETRGQFMNITDVVPTILAAAGVQPQAKVKNVDQSPFDGLNFTPTFTDSKAQSPRKVQYFEMFGNRAIWADGWKAVVSHRTATWDFTVNAPFTDDKWQLFDLKKDISETTDLSSRNPGKLKELEELFDAEARRNNVYPLTNVGEATGVQRTQRIADIRRHGGVWRYSGVVERIPESGAPPITAMSYKAQAKVRLDKAEANGVLFAMGGDEGGLSFYILNGRPTFAFTNVDLKVTRVQADRALPAGPADLSLEFTRADPQGASATARLFANGQQVAEGQIPGPLPWLFSVNEAMGVGVDPGTSASPDYATSPRFDGELQELRIELQR